MGWGNLRWTAAWARVVVSSSPTRRWTTVLAVWAAAMCGQVQETTRRGLMAAIWISKARPEPAIYSQEREAMGGARIRVRKLRTMHMGAEDLLWRHLREHPEAMQEWRRFGTGTRRSGSARGTGGRFRVYNA